MPFHINPTLLESTYTGVWDSLKPLSLQFGQFLNYLLSINFYLCTMANLLNNCVEPLQDIACAGTIVELTSYSLIFAHEAETILASLAIALLLNGRALFVVTLSSIFAIHIAQQY